MRDLDEFLGHVSAENSNSSTRTVKVACARQLLFLMNIDGQGQGYYQQPSTDDETERQAILQKRSNQIAVPIASRAAVKQALKDYSKPSLITNIGM